MRFCDHCGSRMISTKQGYECPKCRTVTRGISEMQRESRSKESSNHVYVLEKKEENVARVKQKCPECGNKEAYRWFTSISGEHAGIRREATIEHFKCTKCSYSWTKIS